MFWFVSLALAADPTPPAPPANPNPVGFELSLTASGHCAIGEATIFQCDTAKGKTVSLCATANEVGATGLQYRFGKIGTIELAYPAVMTEGLTKIKRHSQNFAQSMLEGVQFENDAHLFTVYDQIGSGATEGNNGSGVLIEKGGKQIAKVDCAGATIEKFAILDGILAKTTAP